MKSRIFIIFAGLICAWSLLAMRAAVLQIFPNQRLDRLESRQFQSVINLNSRRGSILDRNGNELAISSPAYSLYADPSMIESKRWVAKTLAKELGHYPPTIFEKIKDKKKRFVWLQRQVSIKTYEKIKSLKIKGINFVEEPRRIYPNDNLLSQTLGIVGSEGRGLEGIELKYDEKLRGNPKKFLVRRDARGRPLTSDGLLFTEAPEGSDLHLTVDREIQYVLERELQQAIGDYEAESAVGVVLDAKTSAIVAMASSPSFNANQPSTVAAMVRRNRTVTDIFEPGSTMKTFIVAGALREGLLQPNSKYFCENGSFKVGKRIIREADAHHSFGFLSVSEILAYSSNIGTTKIAFQMGPEMVRRTLADFGFGQKQKVDLPGESFGTLHKLPWHDHLLSNISFGHGVTGSALQVANAYAAIANGGTLHQPYIVQSIRDGETGEVTETQATEIRRVLTSDESAKMRLLLTGVTAPKGTGVNAKVPGFLVAGKTGTAQKVNPNGRGYLPGAYISSFAGFIPANDPKFVIYVAVDSPKKNYYGSQVAAPIFSKVASFAVRKEGIAPIVLSESDFNPVRKIDSEALQIQTLNEKVHKEISIKDLKNLSDLSTPVEVPDFMGLTAREVLRRVRGQDVRVILKGSGVVGETDPRAGQPIPEDRRIMVWLKNPFDASSNHKVYEDRSDRGLDELPENEKKERLGDAPMLN